MSLEIRFGCWELRQVVDDCDTRKPHKLLGSSLLVLNVFVLTIVEDALSEGAKARLRPEGLMIAMLFTFETSDFLKEKSHCRVGMRESTECRRLVVCVGRRWLSFPLLERFGVVRLPILGMIRFPVVQVPRALLGG